MKWFIVDDCLLVYQVYAILALQGHRVQPMSQATGEDLIQCDKIHSPRAMQVSGLGLQVNPFSPMLENDV